MKNIRRRMLYRIIPQHRAEAAASYSDVEEVKTSREEMKGYLKREKIQ